MLVVAVLGVTPKIVLPRNIILKISIILIVDSMIAFVAGIIIVLYDRRSKNNIVAK